MMPDAFLYPNAKFCWEHSFLFTIIHGHLSTPCERKLQEALNRFVSGILFPLPVSILYLSMARGKLQFHYRIHFTSFVKY